MKMKIIIAREEVLEIVKKHIQLLFPWGEVTKFDQEYGGDCEAEITGKKEEPKL